MFHIPYGQPVPTASYMGDAAVPSAPMQPRGPVGMMQRMGMPQEQGPEFANYDANEVDITPSKASPEKGMGLTALATGGLAVLLLLVAFPISDAAILLNDFNFLFWAGTTVPTAVIIALVSVLVLYVMVIVAHGAAHGPKRQSKVELANIAMVFFMLLGVTLGLASMFMFHKEASVAMSLKYGCSGNLEAGEAQRHYSNLLKLRETPACATKYSITECTGYATAAPAEYINYFRSLEENFRCSGFCYVEPAAPSLAELDGGDPDASAMCQTKVLLSQVGAHGKGNPAAVSLAEEAAHPKKDAKAAEHKADAAKKPADAAAAAANSEAAKAAKLMPDKAKAPAKPAAHAHKKAAAEAKKPAADTVTKVTNAVNHASAAVGAVVNAVSGGAATKAAAQQATAHRPHALFSTINYKQSCDGAAARALSFQAMGTSNVWCWMAMALIGTSASLGFGQWLSSK